MSDAPKTFERPLSPHLQVYRLPMTAIMSITHRMTGVALSGGCLLITAYLIMAAMGANYYSQIQAFGESLFGMIIMFAWSLALYYHLFNGIRHLIWDTVHLLDERKAIIAGWIVLLCAAIFTAGTWYIVAFGWEI